MEKYVITYRCRDLGQGYTSVRVICSSWSDVQSWLKRISESYLIDDFSFENESTY